MTTPTPASELPPDTRGTLLAGVLDLFEVECHGNWVEVPVRGTSTPCPTCASVFEREPQATHQDVISRPAPTPAPVRRVPCAGRLCTRVLVASLDADPAEVRCGPCGFNALFKRGSAR